MESFDMVRYEVAPHRVAENNDLVRAVAPLTNTPLRQVGSYRVLDG